MFKHFLEKIMNERDEVNMCKALEDMKASAKQEEREQSIFILVESLRELDIPRGYFEKN